MRSAHDTMQRRFGSVPAGSRAVRLSPLDPAATSGRSIFPSRVFEPGDLPRLLKSGHHSRKIGKTVAKGPRRGWPIFTLTLEERATCPRTCREWLGCYGNNMHAAERIQHCPDLIEQLGFELSLLADAHPGGFLVRLHVLGDFWSVVYVEFWSEMLGRYPALHLFGFTAHEVQSEIGHAVALLIADAGWARAAIRFSGAPHEHGASRVLGPDETDPDAILCPAQTGATDCCATCALCWHSPRSIAFRRH